MSLEYEVLDGLLDTNTDSACLEPHKQKPCPPPAPPCKEDHGCGCLQQPSKEICCKIKLKDPCIYTCYECKYICRRKVFEPPMKKTCCSPFCKSDDCCKCCCCHCCECCCK